MEVSVETIEGLERRLTVQIPKKKIDDEQAKRIQKISKTVKIDGFRIGKVPLKIIEHRFGPAIKQETLNETVSSTLTEALIQENLHPAEQPKIEITTFEPDKPLVYTATFEVFPKINLINPENVEIEKLSVEITEADIDKTLENMRKQYIEWKIVDRPAQNRDQVIIDFEGFIDDKPFDNGKASEVPLVLGSNSMIPKFEDGIIGAKTGDEFEIEAQFPDNYYNKDFADKLAQFKIKVHKVSEPQLPELNDEFSKRLGIKEGITVLREQVQKTLKYELKKILAQINKTTLLNKLLELNKIDIPKILVENEIDHLREQALQQIAKYTSDKNKAPEIPKEKFEKEAKRRVALGLLISELSQLYDIKVEQTDTLEFIREMSKEHETPEQFIEWIYKDKNRIQQIAMIATEEKTIKKLFETVKIQKKQVSFDELNKISSTLTSKENSISF